MTGSAERHLRQLQQRVKLKQFDAALLSARKYAAAEPGNPAAHYWEGYCLMRLRKPQQAETPLRKALAIDAQHAESLSLLGRCLIGQGRHRDALETARQAETLASDNAEVWDAIGVVYGQLHEYQEAVRMFRRVRELRPDSARNLFNLAGMLNFCHEIAESEAVYREALRLEPTRFLSYWSLSQMKKQTAADNNIALLRAQLQRYASHPDGGLHLNLALAKELEDLGEYAQSFEYLQAGMANKRRRLKYDLEQDRRLFTTLQDTFSPAFCQRETAASDNGEPIFILGMPRTGTTLLEQIVGAHTEVFAAGELQNFFAAWVAQARSQLERVTPLATMACGAQLDFARLGDDYVASTRPRTGHSMRFIDKMPNNFLYLGAIALALPQAKILHMTRHPMDTCYSNYKQLFGRNACPYSYTQEEMAGYYLLYRDLMAHWESCFPGRICRVSYEQLVSDTENEARRVMDFLELDWQEDCLQYHRLKQAVGTASTAQVRQPVYTSSVQKWRCYEQQLQPMRDVLVAAGVEI
ncbi:tetratricopeptide repeat protein [Pseudohalioglobus sediminis]|uniref:Tetratricopeptide repeat protein n=1 Tax=Pseudohalioglobus sediminis TaxID=2606449 RepID=A0A5B0X4L3_9GAMM|nr:sulfotransferase [Pseudohalioglobus sediminis]KAA1194330.1 tetratricopeptide repeat protein [Pseudohalioglobus sediminis]